MEIGCMAWKDLACLSVIILGVIMFLYGANYYDASIGWAGVYIIIIGLIARVILIVWDRFRKSDSPSMD
jgi:hypothetical protein